MRARRAAKPHNYASLGRQGAADATSIAHCPAIDFVAMTPTLTEARTFTAEKEGDGAADLPTWLREETKTVAKKTKNGDNQAITVKSVKPTSAQIVPPGEQKGGRAAAKEKAAEAPVDEALVDEAVAKINAIHVAKGLEAARETGEYIVQAFFGGSLEVSAGTAKKNPSFRALAEREDLNVSHSFLWYSVAVLGQLHQLPQKIGNALPMSHHRLLLPVKAAHAKVELATKAVESGLSKAAFATEVKAVRKEEIDPNRTGRPELPAWAKGIGSIRKAVETACGGDITAADVKAKGVEKLQERRDEVAWAIEQLPSLLEDLDAALAAAQQAGTAKE